MGFIPEPTIRSLNKIESLNTWIQLISGISTMFRSWKYQCCLKWDVINQVWSNINAILAWAREVICEPWQQEATSKTSSFEGKAACVQAWNLALRKQDCDCAPVYTAGSGGGFQAGWTTAVWCCQDLTEQFSQSVLCLGRSYQGV